ncbi:MAG: isoleucine--tRNA ligase [Francisellaceae bacterium]|nr:isoleucine--tRNA ligase [Francisellaceae bacterium]
MSVDYKETLNLPKTKFPMKANLAQREPNILKFWQDIDLYNKMISERSDKEKFVLNDGPPYANGNIHAGHALNKILKDIINKSKLLSGYQTPFTPGWDCHGLPIELNVEKKVGKAGHKCSIPEFRKACRVYAGKQVDLQREGFKRLGIIADWDNPYITMDYKFEANIIRTLAKVVENNHLHKGERPVHWCLDCRSALAEAEVEYKNKTSKSIFVAFPAKDVSVFLKAFNLSDRIDNLHFVIWTTTPWTLPANEAVALHPNYDYVLVSYADKNYVLSEQLLDSCIEQFSWDNNAVKKLATAKGNVFENLYVAHPFYDKMSKIILGDHVTLEAGTGCVHTAPAHGYEDYIAGKDYDLPIENPVGPNGCFVEGTPLLAGVPIYKANDEIITLLSEKNLLLHRNDLEHSYPHCWRHKTPLIFRATPQWFVSMEKAKLRENALAAIEKVKWHPSWGQARITKMVEGRPDWCISRQRVWGVPLPLLVHNDTGELHPDTVVIMRKVADLVSESGVDAWYEAPLEQLIDVDVDKYTKVEDILDVWFDSGSVFSSVLQELGLPFPADLYLEGSDQHRGWFQTSLLLSVATQGCAPFKEVLTHGFIVDGQGRKMSKSVGNVEDPSKVFKTLGADVFRLWVSSVDHQGDASYSQEILKRISEAYRKLRNTARFLLANLHDFDPYENMVAPKDLLALDTWIVQKAKMLQEEVQDYYNSYNFHAIYQLIHNFCTNELGSFYLDVIKDRQYTAHANSLARRSCQTAMYHVIQALVRWLAPIISFTAEEIWQNLPGYNNDTIFLTTWYEFPQNLNAIDNESWDKILLVRDEVNRQIESARQSDILGSALEANIVVFASDEYFNVLASIADELKFVFITSLANVDKIVNAPKDAISGELDGIKISLCKSDGDKCERCWHRLEEVGTITEHPSLCKRCTTNLISPGEHRAYA